MDQRDVNTFDTLWNSILQNPYSITGEEDVQMESLLNSILQKFSECSDGSRNLREDREQEMNLFLRDRLERVKPERMNELLKKLVNIGSTKIIECIANIDITISLPVTNNIRTALHDSLKAKVQPPIDALSKIYGHVNYSALDEEGCTISHLHVAVKEKCAAAVANLLKKETRKMAFEAFKKNFSYLIKYDGSETLEVLLQTGFKSDEYVNEKRRTPLSHLCRRISEHRYYYGTTPEPGDDVAAIRLLVQYGADVNSPDADGRTPLMTLFNSGITEVDKQLDIARLLLDNGAEVNRCDESGETILHVVLRVWHLEEYHGPSHDPRRSNEPSLRVLKLLLERGAVVNARNHDGQTPLLIAVVYCNLDAVGLLLEHDANLGGVNFSGGYMEPSNGFLRNLEMTQNAIAILKLLESRGFTIRTSSTMTWLHFLMGFAPSQKYYKTRYVLAYVEDPERIRKYFDYIPNVIEDNEELDEEYTRRSEKERHAMIAIIEIDNYLKVFKELRLPISTKMISVLEHTGRELRNKYNLSYIDATTDDEFRPYVIEQRSIDEALRRAELTQISETATLLDVCRHSSEAAYEKLKNSNYESVLEDYDNFKTNFPYIGIYLKGCITKALVKGQFKEKTRKMSMKNPA